MSSQPKRAVILLAAALFSVSTASAVASEADGADDATAVDRLTAAVLGDGATAPIHASVLGFYYDEDDDEYVVVVPRTGNVPTAEDYAEFGLAVRIERRDELEARADEVSRALREFARETGEGIGWYFDEARGKVVADGIAPASRLSDVIDRFPDLLEYTQINPENGIARWWVDPSALPLADDTLTIPAFIRERACASGSSPEGRVLEPTIEYDLESIIVTFMVEGLGIATCPGNPSFAVSLVLDEALMGRSLLDGSESPPRHATSGDPDT